MAHTGQQQTFSAMETKQVEKIQFNIMSREEILAMAVCEIKKAQMYEFDSLNPIPDGILDLRMGTSSHKAKCQTCEGSLAECPGHFGYINLHKPVYHVGFIEYVKKILQCVCFRCSRLLVPENHSELKRIQRIKNGAGRLREMVKLSEKYHTCRTDEEDQEQLDASGKLVISGDPDKNQDCGYRQPKYSVNKLSIRYNPKEVGEEEIAKEQNLPAEQCLAIFKKISDSTCKLLGMDRGANFSRPENLIITVLPVAPIAVRPSVQAGINMACADDLTHQYMKILKINNEIQKLEENGQPPIQIVRQVELLQFYVATLMNNELSGGLPQAKLKSGKPIKSIRERLKGKEGRLRKNLMGKRVDFSARTVVSPDPNLAVDELGVPRSIALGLTFPEVVTPLNIERLKQLVINGPNDWPGAKTLIRNDGKCFDLRYAQNREDIQLDYGYIIERHIVNGDYVVFNRQPSLHRASMMGHRVRVLPYSSFRLNLSVTTPYNADFDGDEMNMHVPQSYETKAEIKYIMHVENQIVSPQTNKPVMGLVQDTLCGIRLLTKRDTFLTKYQFMNLMLWYESFDGQLPKPAILKPQQLWTGKQLISKIIPSVNLEKECNIAETNFPSTKQKNNYLDTRDYKIIIEKGQLLSGMLDKGVVGNTGGGLLHLIWLDHGQAAAGQFLTDAQKIVINWMVQRSFSVGVSDIFADEAVHAAVREELDKADLVVPDLFQQASEKKMDHQPGKNMMDTFEYQVNFKLNHIFNDAQRKAKEQLNDKNNIYCMVASGSKGSQMNIAQIMACLGQQNVEGKRIPFGFYRRTLPHFAKDDYGPDSRGFVRSSFLLGLTPFEFYFQAMGGREGIIDTAVKTSETGYLQRRLIKALEDIMVKYDGTVRDSSGNIIQFLYGEDGLNAERIESCGADFIEMTNEQIQKEFQLFDANDVSDYADQLQKYEKDFDPAVLESLINQPESLTIIQNDYAKLLEFRQEIRKVFPKCPKNIHLPVNVQRLIKNIKKNNLQYNSFQEEENLCKLSPVEVIREVDKCVEKLRISVGDDPIALETQQNAILLQRMVIKFYLSPKRVCIKEKISPEVFYEILGEIDSKYNASIVHPGEMVGIICAQSIGEPTTQMTLNTFHFAGNSSKNVTLGVPRIKEVLNVGKNIKTPSMNIYVTSDPSVPRPTSNQNKERVQNIQATMEYTTLGHMCTKSELYFDPNPEMSVVQRDQTAIDMYYMMPDEDADNLSLWMLRLSLDTEAMEDRKMKMSDIKAKILQHIGRDKFQIIAEHTNNVDEVPVIRIRTSSEIPLGEQVMLLKGIEQKLLDKRGVDEKVKGVLRLKGVEHIKKVYMKQEQRKIIDETGKCVVLKAEQQPWMMETDGTNLKKILCIPGIDHTRTITNDCLEISQVLGIEASRLSVFNEIWAILDTYAIYVNYRHLITLCDLMTQRGTLTSISRHGINRVIDGPFRKASFEQTVEILFGAGVFSEVQNMYGLTENLMFGQLCPIGTGFFELKLNVEQAKQALYVPDETTIGPISGEQQNELYIQNYDNPISTPKPSQTPVYQGGMTPGMGGMSVRTPDYPSQGFTPTNAMHGNSQVSPTYYKNNLFFDNNLESPNHLASNAQPGPNPSLFSPKYIITSPVYSPQSSQGGSPRYSPQQSNLLQYSPASPTYNSSSVSPNYSQESGGKNYSPASPGYNYTLSSPSYNQNQKFSPSSPNYTGSPISMGNTPGSGMGGQSAGVNQVYSPNSPNYNVPTGQINHPQSPVYDANNTAVITSTKPLQNKPDGGMYSSAEDSDEEKEDKEVKQ